MTVGAEMAANVSRREFAGGVTAFVVSPALVAGGRYLKTPLMLALEDKSFYETSGGGVTLSGGEPLFFWEWTAVLLRRFKKAGLHTCLDTSLYAPAYAIDAVVPHVDMWLADYKADDEALHQKFTGVSNKIIKRNLERLVSAKAKLEVRCLVVPGCTEDMSARYAYLESIGISRKDVVELEYFDYARSKYKALGIPDTMPEKRSQ